MELHKIISSMNNELSAVMLGFYFDEANCASQISEDICSLINCDELPVNERIVDYYVQELWGQGVLRTSGSAGNQPGQKFILYDRRYSKAARMMLKFSQDNGMNLFDVLGHRRGTPSPRKSSLQNRLGLMLSLYSNGSPQGLRLYELAERNGLKPIHSYTHLGFLADNDLVNIPERKIYEGISYHFSGNLKDFFESKIHESSRMMLEFHRHGKEFSTSDLEGSVHYIRRILRNLISEGAVSYKLAEDNVTRIYTVTDENKFVETCLNASDRAFFSFYCRHDKSHEFSVHDLKPYFSDFKPMTVHHYLFRLADEGVIVKDEKANSQEYSLTGLGVRLCHDFLIPIERMFNGIPSEKAEENGEYHNGMDEDQKDRFIRSALSHYSIASPHSKSLGVMSRANRIGNVLAEEGELSAWTILHHPYINPEGVKSLRYPLGLMLDKGFVTRRRQGSFSIYSLTEKGSNVFD